MRMRMRGEMRMQIEMRKEMRRRAALSEIFFVDSHLFSKLWMQLFSKHHQHILEEDGFDGSTFVFRHFLLFSYSLERHLPSSTKEVSLHHLPSTKEVSLHHLLLSSKHHQHLSSMDGFDDSTADFLLFLSYSPENLESNRS